MQRLLLLAFGLTAILLVSSFFLPKEIFALETTLFPLRDTYIKPGGGENHGFESILLIENVRTETITYRSYVYIIFGLDSLPQNAIIDQATLSLTLVENHTDNCSVQVQRQGDAWNEYENYFSLGYSNTGTIYDIAYIVDPKAYNWEVTQLVSEWHSGKFQNYGVVMFATDECRKLFASRQHENQGSQPKVIVSYHLPPSPTPSPKPTATPTPLPTPSPRPTPTIKITPSPLPTITPSLTITPTPTPLTRGVLGGEKRVASLLLITAGAGVACYFIWKKKFKK